MIFKDYLIKSLIYILVVSVVATSCNVVNINGLPFSKTPTPAISKGPLKLTIGSEEIALSTLGGNDANIRASSIDLGDQVMVITNDSDKYLPSINFINKSEVDKTIVPIVKRKTPDNLSIETRTSFAHSVNVAPLQKKLIGQTDLKNLTAFLAEKSTLSTFGVLLETTGNTNDHTELLVYETPTSGVILVINKNRAGLGFGQDPTTGFKLARPTSEFLIGSLLVLLVVIPIGGMVLSVTSEINKSKQSVEVADLKGLSDNDISSLQLSAAAKAMAKGGGNNRGEGAAGKLLAKITATDYDRYLPSATIIETTCKDKNDLRKVIGQDPAPGTKIIPLDQTVTLYVCTEVSDKGNSVVTATITYTPRPTATPTPTPTPTPTKVPPTKTNTPSPTKTVSPTSSTMIFEGRSVSCTCQNCSCDSNPSFRVAISISSNGTVSGIFYKYTEFFPDMRISGSTSKITGSVRDDANRGLTLSFEGKLSSDKRWIDAKLQMRGNGVFGERVLRLNRK